MRWQVARGNIIFSKKHFVSLAEKRKFPLRLFEKLSFLRIHQAQNSQSQISTYRPSCPSSYNAGFQSHEPSLVALATQIVIHSSSYLVYFSARNINIMSPKGLLPSKKKKVYYSPQLSVHISKVDLYDNLFIGQEKSVCCLH